MRRLQLLISLVRFSERCNSCKYIYICSSHVLLGLLRLLLPSTMMLLILLIEASKVILRTCPNHLNLFSRIFAEIGATPSLSLNSWFLIQSINVWPHIHLNICISITFILYMFESILYRPTFLAVQQAGWLPLGKIYLLIYLETSYRITPRWLLATWANPLVYCG